MQQWGGSIAIFFTYTHFSHDLCASLLAALLPLIKEGLELSYLQSGFLLSAYTITSGLSQVPGGWISDRFNRYAVIAIGLAGVSITTLAVGLSPTYYSMLIILAIMGIFAGAYHPSAAPLLSNQMTETKIGKAIALHMVGGSIGFAIGPIIGGLIAEWLGWRFAFIILSIPALVALPIMVKQYRESVLVSKTASENQPPAGDTDHKRGQSITIFQILRPISIIFILVVLTQLIGGTAMAFIPVYLVDNHHVTPAYAAMLIGLTRGGGLVGSLFGGWLSDKWGRKKAIFLSLVATGPVLYLLTFLPFNAGLIIILIIFGVVTYMKQATVQPFLMNRVPPHMRGMIFGIYFGLSMEGMSLLQPFAGYFMDIFGIIAVFNVTALISIALSATALLFAKSHNLQDSDKIIS